MMAHSEATRFMALLLCVCILFCPVCMILAEETPAATEESNLSTASLLPEKNPEPAEKDTCPIQEPSATDAPTPLPEQPLPMTETSRDVESQNQGFDNEAPVERISTEQAALSENSENISPNATPSGTVAPDTNDPDDGSNETAAPEPDTENEEEVPVPEKQEEQTGDEPGKDENEEDKQEEPTQADEPVSDEPVNTKPDNTEQIEPEPVDTTPDNTEQIEPEPVGTELVVTEADATKTITAETYADKTAITAPLVEDPAAGELSSGELPVKNMPSYYISIPVTFYRIDENSKSTSLSIDINCVSGFDEGDRVDVSVSSKNNMTLRYGNLDSIEYVLRDSSGAITENHTAFASFSESSSLALRLDVIGSPSYAAEYNDILTFTVTFVPGDAGSV